MQTPAPAQFSGDIAGLGGATKPIDADRKVNAFFGELNIPVVKNFDANLALRWDDYSDFGSTTNWKGNLRWQPTQQLLVRGSYGTGFRAPTLSDLYTPQVLQTSSQFNDPVTGESDLQVNDLNGGNPDLQPETSTQWSVGLVFQPMPSCRLAWTSSASASSNVDLLAFDAGESFRRMRPEIRPTTGLVIRDPLTNQIVSTKTLLTNTGTMDVNGLDLNVNYREKLGAGVLSSGPATAPTTSPSTSRRREGDAEGQRPRSTADGNPVISLDQSVSTVTALILRYKQYMAATWQQGDWATTVGNSFATGYNAG